MILTNHSQVLSNLCRTLNQWGMYLSWNEHADPKKLQKSAPYLDWRNGNLDYGFAYIFFTSEEEMIEKFKQTKGDDYRGNLNIVDEARIYAETCSPTGQLLTCNT